MVKTNKKTKQGRAFRKIKITRTPKEYDIAYRAMEALIKNLNKHQ